MGAALRMLLISLLFRALPPLFAYEAPGDKKDVFSRQACPAFLVFENVAYVAGMTMELPCHCKPEEAVSAVWYHQKHLGSKRSIVLADSEGKSVVDSADVQDTIDLQGRFIIRLFSLLLFRAREDDSGYYVCGTASKQFFYAYYVDIQKVVQVSLSQQSDVSVERGEEPQYYSVFTSYWPWSTCDRCGVTGEQVQMGLCYVQSRHLRFRYRHSPVGVAPCGSPAVPSTFRLADAQRGVKLAVRSCHVPCPAQPTLPPQQKSFLAFLGYSGQAAQVPVHYQNHPEGSYVVLGCPGAKRQQAVGWDRGQEKMFRVLYMQGLDHAMRVYIDAGGYLHFHPIWLTDKASYYCWLGGKIAAEIRLGVYLPLGVQRQPSDPRSVFVLKAILISYMFLTILFTLFLAARCSFRYARMQSTTGHERKKNCEC